jgi:Aldos-2-ulose dehydratase, beta-propeller domain/FG-GAP-like repeat/FG-GAP repeat
MEANRLMDFLPPPFCLDSRLTLALRAARFVHAEQDHSIGDAAGAAQLSTPRLAQDRPFDGGHNASGHETGLGLFFTVRKSPGPFLVLLLAIALNQDPAGAAPHFVPHTIATELTGGYQVVAADLNHDGKPDLIALASGRPDLVWFENPGWQRHVIASNFTAMINCTVLDEHGRPAVVLASGFSNDARRSRGELWLLEPQTDVRRPWHKRLLDRLPTSHRLRLADIDGSGRPVVLDAALTGPHASPPDYQGHAPLVFYRPGEWKRHLVSDENPGVMHGLCVVDWAGSHHDQILTASFGGIARYQLLPDGQWQRTEIAHGSPLPWPKCGASDVAVGHLGHHRFLCSIEPWHGNQVVVYRRHDATWERRVIDDSFLDGHVLATADLDSDGRDEIIAGYRGKGGGLVFYTAQDPLGEHWTRSQLDMGGITAAGCAVVDLNGDGRLDIVCIGSATANLRWYENR